MTTYYKGNLVLAKNIILKKIKFCSNLYGEISEMKINQISGNAKITNEELKRLNAWKKLTDIIRFKSNVIYDDYNKKLLFNLLKKNYKNEKIQIIYEIVYDRNGNPYAKEKNYGGLIFPLFNLHDLDYFYIDHVHKGLLYDRVRGNFSFELKNRDNFDLTDCYCFQCGVANQNEIIDYVKKYGPNSDEFYKKVRYLYNMNVFDNSIINDYQSSSISNITSNNQTNNIPANSNVQQSINQTNSSNIQIKNSINTNSTLSKSPTSIRLEILENLENIKNKLNNLSDKEIALLRDMTNNNLNDPNILEYIDMPLDKKLEFLEQKAKENSSKVSLEKKKTYK